MTWKPLDWAWRRYRPEEGWLSFFLLLGTILCLTAAVIAVEWVPEVGVVAFTAPLGLVLGTVLARRQWPALPAWLLLLAYGLLATFLYLGKLVPPLTLLFRGEGGAYFRQQVALFLDRAGSWFLAVSGGGSSQETIVFASGLGLLAWFLAAYAAWSTYRQRRPLLGIGLVGLALATNGYFGGEDAPLWYAAIFIGLMVFLVAAMHFANLEQRWRRRGVDYSREIRIELLAAAGGSAAALLVLAFIVPTIRFSAIARAFQQSAGVQQAEEALDRAFGGVRAPGGPGAAYEPGGSGVFPRAFLLGDAPELYETEMMTATLSPAHSAATHWRAASYDRYTGRGWALSEERQEVVPAGAVIPLPVVETETRFEQVVHWVYDDRNIRYTIGLPLRLNEESRIYWRGVEDFSRAHAVADTTSYSATSRLPTPGPNALRQATLAAIPPLIVARYTELPEELPERIPELAQEIVAGQPTPYDQARALEAFLRQYPYSLEVPPPPRGRDPVDYFLFDLQAGYCDYYATAMAVLARSLGLPARLATGYLAQPPAENGVQTIYQINAHAWTEIYFAGYGWVEFEPTATFPTVANAPAVDTEAEEEPATPEAPVLPPPLPEADEERISPLWGVPLIILLLLGWYWWHRQQNAVATDGVLSSYARLRQAAGTLGLLTPASQTPAELEAIFVERLATWERHPRLQRWLQGLRPGVARLTDLFIARQYGRPDSGRPRPGSVEARALWRRLGRRLWLLRLYRRLFLHDGKDGSHRGST